MASRVQLALNVSDIDQAVDFYSKLFGVGPAKRREGYANFAVDVPPLKLVLIENPEARGSGVTGALNHLGVEVDDSQVVAQAAARLAGSGLETATEEKTTCCYALQDKVWVDDPDGAPWEFYTVLADAPTASHTDRDIPANEAGPGSACDCGPVCSPGPVEVEGPLTVGAPTN